MDINNSDVVPKLANGKAFEVKLKFEDGTIVSPNALQASVSESLKDKSETVRNTVGVLGELCIGTFPPGQWHYFATGWYMRKAVENLEKVHGKVDILVDSEDITKDQAKSLITKFLKRSVEKYNEMIEEIQKGVLDDAFGEIEDD